jgi:hypothetical protein
MERKSPEGAVPWPKVVDPGAPQHATVEFSLIPQLTSWPWDMERNLK